MDSSLCGCKFDTLCYILPVTAEKITNILVMIVQFIIEIFNIWRISVLCEPKIMCLKILWVLSHEYYLR